MKIDVVAGVIGGAVGIIGRAELGLGRGSEQPVARAQAGVVAAGPGGDRPDPDVGAGAASSPHHHIIPGRRRGQGDRAAPGPHGHIPGIGGNGVGPYANYAGLGHRGSVQEGVADGRNV